MPSRPAPQVTIYLDGKVSPNARLLEVFQAMGGPQPDAATLVIEPTTGLHTKDLRLSDLDLISYFENQTCEVEVLTPSGKLIVHYGRIAGGDIEIQGDQIRFTSRFDDHMFGSPLSRREDFIYSTTGQVPTGSSGQSPVTGQPQISTVETDLPHTFNPVVNDRLAPNLWMRPAPAKYGVFIDSESVPRTAFDPIAPTPVLASLKPWTLPAILLYLMWRLNRQESHVSNATPTQLLAVFGKDPPVVREWTGEAGKRLPELISELLRPFGYDSRVKYLARGKRQLAFHKRGAGTPISLRLQQVGADLDTSVSHVKNCRLAVDHVHRTRNMVEVTGDWEEFEATFDLVPAWESEFDDYFGKDLALDSEEMKLNPKLARVWRDWVLNEGGDYTRLRTGSTPYADRLKDPYDLKPIFGYSPYLLRRRRFYPLVTQMDDVTPFGVWDGVYIEWWDGYEWRHVSELNNQSVQVLTDECGIRFSNASSPPEEIIWGAITDAKIRITATIRSDRRVRAIHGAAQVPSVYLPLPPIPLGSVLRDYRMDVVPRGDAYRYRVIHSTSIFHADHVSGAKRSTAADDRVAINKEARQLYEAWNASSISGEVELEGIDYGVDFLGQSIAGIEPRGIRLRTTGALTQPPKFPIVVAVTWSVPNQQTTLRLDTLREERFG